MLVLHYLQNKGHKGSSPNTGLDSPSPDIGGELCPGVRGETGGGKTGKDETLIIVTSINFVCFLLTPF